MSSNYRNFSCFAAAGTAPPLPALRLRLTMTAPPFDKTPERKSFYAVA